ncbi:hypothetical protein CPB85DRAFT_1257930 [Mucidula mucida]|nr:hypothetical protein CPB85DRAFT_1257930 [Mucidula mucida]
MSWTDDYDNHPPAATSMSWADEPYTPHTGFSLSQAITVADSDNEENSEGGNLSDTTSNGGDDQDVNEGNDVDEDNDVDVITHLVHPTPSSVPASVVPASATAANPPAAAGSSHTATAPPAVEPSFVAGVAYYTVPTEELEPHSDSVCSTCWYVVTRGRFVGVFSEASMADDTVTGVSNHFRQKKNNLLTALDVFNLSLRRGAVAVVNV